MAQMVVAQGAHPVDGKVLAQGLHPGEGFLVDFPAHIHHLPVRGVLPGSGAQIDAPLKETLHSRQHTEQEGEQPPPQPGMPPHPKQPPIGAGNHSKEKQQAKEGRAISPQGGHISRQLLPVKSQQPRPGSSGGQHPQNASENSRRPASLSQRAGHSALLHHPTGAQQPQQRGHIPIAGWKSLVASPMPHFIDRFRN